MERNKSKRRRESITLRILHDIGDDKKKLLLIFVVIGIAKLLLSLTPVISGKVTDRIVEFAQSGNYDMKWLAEMCIVLAVMYLCGNGADILTGNIMMSISQNVVKKLRDEGQKKFNRLPIKYMDQHPAGDILTRLTYDMQSLSTALESILGVLVGQFLLLLGVVIMMFITNPLLTLVYIVILPVGFLASRYIVKTCVKLIRDQRRLDSRLASIANDSYNNYMMIKAYGCEEEKIAAFNAANEEFYSKFVKSHFFTGFIMPISVSVSNLAYVIECIIGGFFLINGKLTLGEFQAFLLYGNMVLSPLNALSIAVNSLQNGLVSAKRIYEFLDEEEETDESDKEMINVDSVRGQIEFEHVKFGYSADRMLMEDVNLKTNAGKTIAVVGPTGAGKTTLINLLMRFYDIKEGTIRLDGMDINALSRQSLRKCFGIVLQDSWIFDGTIEENIAYGKQGATQEEVRRAARLVHCDQFIDRLENGYQTHISEEKVSLSSGEKQLLSIARTLVADPSILILDEATSQVDTRTELIITEAMANLMKGRTCFVIAHRLFTIKNADFIIYMEDGDIKEAGTHDELMKKKERYYKLFTQTSDCTSNCAVL